MKKKVLSAMAAVCMVCTTFLMAGRINSNSRSYESGDGFRKIELQNKNPYAIFGSDAVVLMTEAERNSDHVLEIINDNPNDPISRMELDMRTGIAKLFDKDGALLEKRLLDAKEKARWLTQDRFAEKYYPHSPYSYATGNPINVIDINGDSIWYTRHENVITMHVTGSVINQSSSNGNMQRRADKIADGITSAFTGKVEIGGQTYDMVVDVQIGVAGSMSDVSSSDHLFVIADRISGAAIKAEGATSEIGGKVMTMHTGASTRTAVHEFGHAAGLTHKNATGPFNIMNPGQYFGTTVNPRQRATMINRWDNGGVNRGSNSFNPNPYNPNSRVIPNPYLRYERNVGHINQYGLKHGR